MQYVKLFETFKNTYVGIHCSPKALDHDAFYGRITDDYCMTFQQLLELIQVDYPEAKILLQKIAATADGLRLDDASVDLVFEIVDFLAANNLEWIFVANTEAMPKYGPNCYRVYFHDLQQVYSMVDELTDNATIYIYNTTVTKPILKHDSSLQAENLTTWMTFETFVPKNLANRAIDLQQIKAKQQTTFNEFVAQFKINLQAIQGLTVTDPTEQLFIDLLQQLTVSVDPIKYPWCISLLNANNQYICIYDWELNLCTVSYSRFWHSFQQIKFLTWEQTTINLLDKYLHIKPIGIQID